MMCCVRLTHFVFISLRLAIKRGANGTVDNGDKLDQTTLIEVNGDLEVMRVVDIRHYYKNSVTEATQPCFSSRSTL